MFLFSLYFIKTTVVKELSEIYILYYTAWKIFCKQENTSEILMEAKSCILDTVWSIYLYQAEMLHCNVCVCYHEITHAFWELGNISPCLSLQQNSRNYLMAISNPKCLILARKWQGENKQLRHCYERSCSFPLTKKLVIEDAWEIWTIYTHLPNEPMGLQFIMHIGIIYVGIDTIFRCT